MNVLITGSKGFIGKNLKIFLLDRKLNIFEFNRGDNLKKLEKLIKLSDIIFHLAGENRPKKKSFFKVHNIDLTDNICKIIKKQKKKIKIIFTSTTQIHKNNDYAKSKLICEKLLIKLKKNSNNDVKILRLPNIYGKWSRPNYNSVVATFCYNIARNKKIIVHDVNQYVSLYYIDDLLRDFLNLIKKQNKKIYSNITKVNKIKVELIANKIKNFHKNIKNINLNDLRSRIDKNLYSTFISFIPKNLFSFSVRSNNDNRGNFVEFLKSKSFGQVSFFSINVNKTRGEHYHHSKVEQFMILKGSAKIKYYNLYDNKTTIKKVSDKKMQIFRSMPGYIHTIINIGRSKILGIVWANENFNIKKTDTYRLSYD
tara:strand:+ start:1631 stop:2734 length:1104 start_codon:yes stop_codon:yes gene_type:complete